MMIVPERDRYCSRGGLLAKAFGAMRRSERVPQGYSYGRSPKSLSEKGAALVIVLAFVVLLTGLAVAYLSRASMDRQMAQASFRDADADILARGALEIVVGDFKQEVVNGSTAASIPGVYYFPWAKAKGYSVDAVLPQRSGNPAFALPEYPNDLIPNLIRRSVANDPIVAPGIGSRASAVNSTTDVSANGRSVSLARWNSHYLIPKANLSDPTDDSTPTGSFVAPDWIIVTRAGPATFAAWDATLQDATVTNTNYAIGRYAYAVYDEGGLLDVNVAGFPNPGTPSSSWPKDIGRKGVPALADLTALPTTPGSFMDTTAINKIVGFRNYATMGLPSTISNFSFSFNSTQAQNFVNFYTMPSPTPVPPAPTQYGTSQDFGAVIPYKDPNATRTDQNFITRQELIKFRRSTSIASVNTLQYLGTFSRETNAATWRANDTTTTQIENTLNNPGVHGDEGRFWLGNFNLLVPGTPGGGIKQLFGFKWQNAGGGNPGNWRYNGPQSATALDHIPALTGPNRHFTGLLNYALDKVSTDDSANIERMLAITASLIDQWDPNTFTYTDTGILATGTFTTRIDWANGTIYGLETAGDPNKPSWAPTAPTAGGYVQLDRPFRNVGEFGYVFKQASTRADSTLDFATVTSAYGAVLDLFTYNNALYRSGTVSLNTRQYPVLAAILKAAITSESSSAVVGTRAVNTTAANTDPNNAAISIVNATAVTPALSRADIVPLAANNVITAPFGPGVVSDEIRETIPRALVECVNTRSWGLLIDLVAQTGHYSRDAQGLADFVVEGEKRYWLHIVIDRFNGTVLGQRLEEVVE